MMGYFDYYKDNYTYNNDIMIFLKNYYNNKL